MAWARWSPLSNGFCSLDSSSVRWMGIKKRRRRNETKHENKFFFLTKYLTEKKNLIRGVLYLNWEFQSSVPCPFALCSWAEHQELNGVKDKGRPLNLGGQETYLKGWWQDTALQGCGPNGTLPPELTLHVSPLHITDLPWINLFIRSDMKRSVNMPS